MKMNSFLSLFNLKQPILPTDFHTEHFSNEDLSELLKHWGGGNELTDPTSIGLFAERAFNFKDDKEYFADPDIKMMWRDGLGDFLIACWYMIQEKHKQITTTTIVETCNVCGKASNHCEKVIHPSIENFTVCPKCNTHGYMTNLGWNVGE